MTDLLFFTAVSMLLLHEMDAVDKKEWHLLFVLRRLPDDGAMRWFILLHLPLFVALMALVAAGPSGVVHWIEGGVDAFLILHAGLHTRLTLLGDRAFADPFSAWLIRAAAIGGALHLTALLIG